MFFCFENLFHLPLGVVEAGFDGALGAGSDLGDFRDGKVLQEVRDEYFALLDAESVSGRAARAEASVAMRKKLQRETDESMV